MRKLLLVVLLTVIVLFSLGFVSQGTASTNVSDVIPQDISWTKANSPYVFNGSVLVGDRCYAQLTLPYWLC
jgi:hypothetical protein